MKETRASDPSVARGASVKSIRLKMQEPARPHATGGPGDGCDLINSAATVQVGLPLCRTAGGMSHLPGSAGLVPVGTLPDASAEAPRLSAGEALCRQRSANLYSSNPMSQWRP